MTLKWKSRQGFPLQESPHATNQQKKKKVMEMGLKIKKDFSAHGNTSNPVAPHFMKPI